MNRTVGIVLLVAAIALVVVAFRMRAHFTNLMEQ